MFKKFVAMVMVANILLLTYLTIRPKTTAPEAQAENSPSVQSTKVVATTTRYATRSKTTQFVQVKEEIVAVRTTYTGAPVLAEAPVVTPSSLELDSEEIIPEDPEIEFVSNYPQIEFVSNELTEEAPEASYENVSRSARIARLKDDHRNAGTVYEFLSARGWSDVAIAGVLGNMMAECGGQTLTLLAYIYDDTWRYYGMCQWSIYYNPDIIGRDVMGQLQYLVETVEPNMAQFGGDFNHFLAITDAAEAARYFCQYYERGAGPDQRAKNAQVALNWLMDDQIESL